MKAKDGMDYARISLLVKVSQLYYETGLQQNDISEQLGISRSYVSKLLVEAKERGIVTFAIRDPIQAESELERSIRQHYNLRKVIVAECGVEDNATNAVAKKAAQWINSIVKNDDVIAVGWGRTLYLTARHLPQREELSGIKTASLYGQQSFMRQSVFNTEGLTLMTQAFNAVSYVLASPVFIADDEVRRRFLQEESMREAVEYTRRANIALFTIGSPKRSSYLDQPGGLSEEGIRSLISRGAVADVCLHVINRDGEICDPEFDKRLISIPLDELQRKDYRVAIASGRFKMEAVYTALQHGFMNVLVIDEDIAKEIVGRLNAGK